MSKKRTTPSLKKREVVAPKALIPLMQAFHTDSEGTAFALIVDAAKVVYGSSEEFEIFAKKNISKEEIETIIALMKRINPRDTLETLYAAQIVASHMLGMRKLAESYIEDKKLGLSLLKFCNEAMQQLEKKRNGGMQNITVNYNYGGQGNAFMQAVTQKNEE